MVKALVAKKKKKKSNVHFNPYGQMFSADDWRSISFIKKNRNAIMKTRKKKKNIWNLDYGSPII